MKQALFNFLSSHEAMMGLILLVYFLMNAVMVAIKKALDREIARRQAAKLAVPGWEQSVDSGLDFTLKYSAKAIEFLSANSTALPVSVQAEVKAEAALLEADQAASQAPAPAQPAAPQQ